MAQREWHPIGLLRDWKQGDIWLERADGEIELLKASMFPPANARRWTPVLPEPAPTPPPYEEPMPEIAPCKRCGKPGNYRGGGYVACGEGFPRCWVGPEAKTEREAIEAWNSLMK